jgi:hypothetical protein
MTMKSRFPSSEKVSNSSRLPPVPEISPKTNLFLFIGLFYAVLLIYILVAFFSPTSSLTRLTEVFDNFWANFLFLGLSFLFISLGMHALVCFFCKKLLRTKWFKPKLGKVGLREGFITNRQLQEALAEQQLRIGEILVGAGKLTDEQLNDTLDHQRKVSAPLGQVLRELGYSTEEDINWALGRMGRKLGEVLLEKRVITRDDLAWLLEWQEHGTRRI